MSIFLNKIMCIKGIHFYFIILLCVTDGDSSFKDIF